MNLGTRLATMDKKMLRNFSEIAFSLENELGWKLAETVAAPPVGQYSSGADKQQA